MTAKICDRCGRIYEPYTGRKLNGLYANGIILIDVQPNSLFHAERQRWEMCPRCMAQLEEFLKEGEDEC